MSEQIKLGEMVESGLLDFFSCMCSGLLIFTELIFLMGAEILITFHFYNVSKMLRTLNITSYRNQLESILYCLACIWGRLGLRKF